MSNYILYGITIILLIISYCKDKKKTKMALKKACKSFENILPEKEMQKGFLQGERKLKGQHHHQGIFYKN